MHHHDPVFRGPQAGIRGGRQEGAPGFGLYATTAPDLPAPGIFVQHLFHGPQTGQRTQGHGGQGPRPPARPQGRGRGRARVLLGLQVLHDDDHRRRHRGVPQGLWRPRIPGVLWTPRALHDVPPEPHRGGGQPHASPAGHSGVAQAGDGGPNRQGSRPLQGLQLVCTRAVAPGHSERGRQDRALLGGDGQGPGPVPGAAGSLSAPGGPSVAGGGAATPRGHVRERQEPADGLEPCPGGHGQGLQGVFPLFAPQEQPGGHCQRAPYRRDRQGRGRRAGGHGAAVCLVLDGEGPRRLFGGRVPPAEPGKMGLPKRHGATLRDSRQRRGPGRCPGLFGFPNEIGSGPLRRERVPPHPRGGREGSPQRRRPRSGL
mmetsp:Transcript_17051/g.46885  ORF Transcript_17051/g.46885 Transcript_17051/m.46885 type:complete len:371 (+) Transcript_17051:1014-2126(+)